VGGTERRAERGGRGALRAACLAAALLSGCAADGGAPAAGARTEFAGLDAIDAAKRTLIVVGDTQRTLKVEFWRERNLEATRRLLAEIAGRDPAFVINTGDLTAWGSSAAEWEFFDSCNRPLFEKGIPYFPCVGNHDCYGRESVWRDSFRRRFPAFREQAWYRVRFKEVGCLFLDSNFDVLSDAEKKQQDAWYAAELAAFERDSSVCYIVVCCHHAPFSNGTVVPPSPEVAARFAAPFLRTSKGAFFFTGHCHAYERFVREGKQFIVTGGGGGPRHTIVTDEKARKYKDEYAGSTIRPFHFCELALLNGNLECQVIGLRDDGTFAEIDRVAVVAKP
jgi:hypothetical protein